MKTITKLFALAVIILGFSATSFGQVQGIAPTNATIITPISIVKVTNLEFGNVAVQTATAGTVILSPGGTRATGGAGGVSLPATTGTVSAASFTVSGLAGYTYSISLPTTFNVASGANTMVVNTFTSTPTPTGTLSVSGSETLSVGATLNVTAGQAAGTYTSAAGLTVTVNYN